MPQPRPEKSCPSIRYIMAIDLGSGGLKVAIVADSGEIGASADKTVTTSLS